MADFDWDTYDEHYNSLIDMSIYDPKTLFIVTAMMEMSDDNGVTNTADVIAKGESALEICMSSEDFIHEDDICDLMDMVRRTAQLEMQAIVETEMETPIHVNSTIH